MKPRNQRKNLLGAFRAGSIPSGPDPRVVEGLQDVDAGRLVPLEVVRLAFELRFAIEETLDPERVRSEVLQLLRGEL